MGRLRGRLRRGADPPAGDAGAVARLIPTLVNWGEVDLAAELGRRLIVTEDPVPEPVGLDEESQTLAEIAVVGSALCALVPRFAEFRDRAHRACDRMAEVVQGRANRVSGGWDMDIAALIPIAVCLRKGREALDAGRYGKAAGEAAAQVRSILTGGDVALSPVLRPDSLAGLLDLGLTEPVRAAVGHRDRSTAREPQVPGDGGETADVFRWAAIHFRLGDRERAERLFQAGCRRESPTGGFSAGPGASRPSGAPGESVEASGCFLDALFWKIRAAFDGQVDVLPNCIDPGDGRYRLVECEIGRRRPVGVLEVGCGSGRFINRLLADHPGVEAAGLDVSPAMLGRLDPRVSRIEGTCLNIPRGDDEFDLVFSVETLEHAVNVPAAVREMGRVVRPGGCLLIIDKHREKTGALPLEAWEQWFDGEEIRQALEGEGFRVDLIRGVPYSEDPQIKDLFLAWVGTKGGSGSERG